MSTGENIIECLINFIKAYKEKFGCQFISCYELLQILDDLQKNPPQNSSENFLLARINGSQQIATEQFKAAVQSGQHALNIAMLINGAAGVSVLAFIGNVISRSSVCRPVVPPTMVWSLIAFAVGVLFAAVAHGAAYFSNYYFAKNERDKANNWRIATIFIGIICYIAFMAGVCLAANTFLCLSN